MSKGSNFFCLWHKKGSSRWVKNSKTINGAACSLGSWEYRMFQQGWSSYLVGSPPYLVSGNQQKRPNQVVFLDLNWLRRAGNATDFVFWSETRLRGSRLVYGGSRAAPLLTDQRGYARLKKISWQTVCNSFYYYLWFGPSSFKCKCDIFILCWFWHFFWRFIICHI